MSEETKKAEAKKETAQKPTVSSTTSAAAKKTAEKIAVIRIRGMVRVKNEIKDTISMLNLPFNNSCSIIAATPTNLGMLKKAKDYITWGVVDEATIKELETKRGKGKKFFRLHPPIGGFERKGITRPFTTGGALGNRKEKINELIKKMV